jgi:hypothetical protein
MRAGRGTRSGISATKRILPLVLGLVVGHAAHADNVLWRGAGAVVGIYSGIYLHEAGHALAFRAAGADDIRIRVPGTQCKLLCGQTDATWAGTRDPATAQAINVAGFVASNLATELLIQHEGGARTAVGQGIIATNLYSNVSHVVTYYTKIRGRDGYQGNDIDAYELAGGNPHLLSAGLVAYTVYALHRMNRKRIPVLFVHMRF